MNDFTLTSHFSLYKPTTDADADMWGDHWNLNADTIDSALYSLTVGGGASGPDLTLGGDLIMQTGNRLALDTAAYGGVPNMYMYSLGGAFVFYADGWNEWTPSAFRGINFKIYGNGGADEYWGVTGGPNGTGSTLKAYSVSGGWPCIGSIIASNEGQLMLGNDTGTILNIQGPTGQLTKNSIRITGGGPSVDPTIAVIGEANAGLSLVAMGGGNVYAGNANGVSAQFGSAAPGLVNYVQIAGVVTGLGPAVMAQGANTDIPLVLEPKGSGALQGSLVVAANPRGGYAVDWQRIRSANTQIASGNQSVVSGGNSNSASAQYASAGGGFLNNADGYASTIPGGFRAWARGQYGWLGWSSGIIQGIQEGDAQGSWRLLRGISTGGAAVRLTADQLAINTVAPNINSVLTANDHATSMTINLVGFDNTATSTRANAYYNEVLVAKDALGGYLINLGTARTLGVDLPTVSITVGAEAQLNLSVTPINTNTWHFVAKLSCVEMM